MVRGAGGALASRGLLTVSLVALLGFFGAIGRTLDTAWGDFLGDETLAVPVVDCLFHRSHVFMLGGESYRLKQKTA